MLEPSDYKPEKPGNRSCLVGVILLMVAVLALASSVRRFASRSEEPSAGTTYSSVAAAPVEAERVSLWGRLRGLFGSGDRAVDPQPGEFVAAAAAQQAPAAAKGIEGLSLKLSRPMLLKGKHVGGMAVDADDVYVCWSDPERGSLQVSRLGRDRLTVTLSRAIEADGQYAVGGLALVGDTLWTAVRSQDAAGASIVLGLSRATLDTVVSFAVADQVAAVVATSDGAVLGCTADGAALVRWRADGSEMGRAPLSTGAVYSDMDWLGGALVASGADATSGVIDVIDPDSGGLLARHRCYVRAPDGAYLSAGPFDAEPDALRFVAQGGAFPMVNAYTVREGDMSTYIPGSPQG